jgi:hypothetical protein
MIIAIDFDGTCVTHEYPKIGRFIGAQKVLHALVEKGHQLILWTMRSGKYRDEAVKWFEDCSIPLLGVNENPTQKEWTDSPKVYAHLYIDDAALGIPLLSTLALGERPYVDWKEIENMLQDRGVL